MDFAARCHLIVASLGASSAKREGGREESQLIRRDDKAEKVPFCLSPLPPLLLPFHERVLGPAAAIIRRQKTALVDWEYSVDHPSRCHVHGERILTKLHRYFYKILFCALSMNRHKNGECMPYLMLPLRITFSPAGEKGGRRTDWGVNPSLQFTRACE